MRHALPCHAGWHLSKADPAYWCSFNTTQPGKDLTADSCGIATHGTSAPFQWSYRPQNAFLVGGWAGTSHGKLHMSPAHINRLSTYSAKLPHSAH